MGMRWIKLLSLALLCAGSLLISSCQTGGGLVFVWFISDRNGNRDLYRMLTNGADVTQITNGLSINSFDIDRLGRTVVFDSLTDPQIFRMNSDGTGITPITTGIANKAHPSINPAGTHVVFSSGGNLWTIAIDGSGVQILTNTADPDEQPNWGARNVIVFKRNNDIRVVNSDGTGGAALTTSGLSNSGPSWSPDGERVVYSSGDVGGIEIWIMNANGSNKTRVTMNAFNDFRPKLGSDNETLFWYQNQSGNFEIMRKKIGEPSETNLTVMAGLDISPSLSR